MKRLLAIIAIGFALVTATVGVATIGTQQAVACEGDHHGA